MVKRRQVVRFLERNGFVNKGGANHDRFVHPDGKWTMLKRHTEIDNDTFRIIKKQTGLDGRDRR